MGFLDRLLRRTDGAGTSPDAARPGAGPGAAEAGGPPPAGPSGAAGAATGPVVPAWSVTAPIRPAVAPEQRIANARFGGQLATFQNPSSVRARPPAILDGRSPASNAGRHLEAARPAVPGLERPATRPVSPSVSPPVVPAVQPDADTFVPRAAAPGPAPSRPAGTRVRPVSST
ncbi:hypothetical protein ACWGNE_13970, partial [Streptomyces xiamenensis]